MCQNIWESRQGMIDYNDRQDCNEYFGMSTDTESVVYLMMAEKGEGG